MTKGKLNTSVKRTKAETREALQAIYDSLNKGQRQKLLKDPDIAQLLQKYNVEVDNNA